MAASFSFGRDGELVVVTETWRLDDPELPFIVSPWHPAKDEIEAVMREAATINHRHAPMPEMRFIERFGRENLPPA